MGDFSRVRLTALASIGIVVCMLGASYAAVPLYKIFCQVTGFSGTTQRAETTRGIVGERVIRIQFDANVAAGLGWHFVPAQRELGLRVGEQGLAFYTVRNLTDRPVKGSAVFNVTPAKAGYYFNKIDCFCFKDQVLMPGEEVRMPVTFFVDPEIVREPSLEDVTVITLSYTFYEQKLEAKNLQVNDLPSNLKEAVVLAAPILEQEEKEPSDG